MKSKYREFICGLLYVVALFSFLGAVTAESGSGFLDFSDSARLLFCGISAICVIAATLILKTKDAHGKTVKLIAMVIALAVIVVCGFIDYHHDHNTGTQEQSVYSFSGANEYFSLTNGVVVLGAEEEVFSGGDLNISDEEALGDIASYSATFYTLIDGEKHIIMSNSVVDQTGGKISLSGDLGKMSGGDFIIRNKVEDPSDWKNNLYFELVTTGLDNKENTYQLQLSVTEVSGTN